MLTRCAVGGPFATITVCDVTGSTSRQTIAGKRCTVTSSSQHMHADPLRRGERFCAHHRANKHANPIAEVAHELAADECPTCGEWCCICGVKLVYGPSSSQDGEDEELPHPVYSVPG